MVNEEFEIRVDEILHFIWDPIGISCEPGARNEYHSYLPQVISLLNKKSPKKLIQYLELVQTEKMGLPSDVEHNTKVSQVLFNLKKSYGL